MEILSRNTGSESQTEWDMLVEACHDHPIATLEQIYDLLEQLNTKKAETEYEFYLQPVVEGEVQLNANPHFFIGGRLVEVTKSERPGPVIRALLSKLPQSVRTGQDDWYEVYQIRLNELGSYEFMMGTTTLLCVILCCRAENDACYLFPNDPNSQKNWSVLVDMHAEQFPQLGVEK